MENLQATGTRLIALRSKLKAREGVAGYEKNCEELRKEIARLEPSTLTTSGEASEGITKP